MEWQNHSSVSGFAMVNGVSSSITPVLASPIEIGAHANRKMVLLVDDDVQLRALMKDILSDQSYHVTDAADGEMAIRLYRKTIREENPFELVILDLHLPIMSGQDCMGHLIQLNPQVKVLLTSGLSPQEMQENKVLSKAKGILVKPFSVQELLSQVGGLMG
jgi:DNA-binding response OmpR family regulator